MIEVHTSSSPLNEISHKLTQLLKEHKGKKVLLLFSGGSSLAIIDHLHPKHITKNTTITVLDERYTFDRNENNFSKLEDTTFFRRCKERNIPYIDPRPFENETLEETAKRFDHDIKHWHVLNREGIVLATVGIGTDGHTSGVLPMGEDTETFKKLFLDDKKCIVGYTTTPEKNPHTERITTTLSYFVRHIHHALVYAAGKQKKEALLKTLESDVHLAKTPSQVLQQVHDAHLYTDLNLR